MPRIKVVFRVDSSAIIGSGHIVRCIALASELRDTGCNCIFVCLNLEDNLSALIRENGFEVILINASCAHLLDGSRGYTLPLFDVYTERYSELDAKITLGMLGNEGQQIIFVVDHYGLDQTWEKIVGSYGHKICAIDDLLRNHACDILVDQTFFRSPSEYKKLVPNGIRLLTGSTFALLRKQFQRSWEPRATKIRRLDAKVLVNFGGFDNSGLTARVLKTLEKLNISHLTVIAGEKTHKIEEISSMVACQQWKHYSRVSNMAEQMACHDIAIGSPGTSSFERACAQLPSIVIPIAENQLEIARRLQDSGIHEVLKLNDVEKMMPLTIKRLIEGYDTYVASCRGLCDGKGSERVAEQILKVQHDTC